MGMLAQGRGVVVTQLCYHSQHLWIAPTVSEVELCAACFSVQMSVRNCFVRGSVVRYVLVSSQLRAPMQWPDGTAALLCIAGTMRLSLQVHFALPQLSAAGVICSATHT
jgi:hypothetical protein